METNNTWKYLCIAFALGFASTFVAAIHQSNKLENYYRYQVAAENLLDDLNNQYDWTDGTNAEEYYETYKLTRGE
jgi:hypothetical protein